MYVNSRHQHKELFRFENETGDLFCLLLRQTLDDDDDDYEYVVAVVWASGYVFFSASAGCCCCPLSVVGHLLVVPLSGEKELSPAGIEEPRVQQC